MTRRLSIALAALASAASLGVSLTSCNPPSCGPGTVQQQQKDGTLKCILVDQPEAGIQCDVDAGNVTIVGGKCVSAVQCDPATTVEVNGVCVSRGMVGNVCSTPAPGKGCIDGTIINFKTNAKGSDPIDVQLYSPTTLLSGGAAVMTCQSDGATYKCQDFNPGSLQLGLAVIVAGGQTMGFVPAGSAGQNIGAAKYTIDTYEVKKADADAWGFDYATNGAFIAKFYSDAAPTGNVISASTDTHPVSGVTLIKDGGNAMAQYFDANLTMVTSGLTTTSSSGAAIVAAPVSGTFPTFTGMGGVDQMGMPINWQTLNGGSTAGFVLILRFHPM